MLEAAETGRPHSSSHRRTNKPLVEKKRRARINNCLTQLKGLVLHAMKQDGAQFSRLEKADILEMTVKYLRHLQRQQVSAAMATNPAVVAKYRAGFTECASEVMRYLGSSPISDDVRARLNDHLAGRLSVATSSPREPEVAPPTPKPRPSPSEIENEVCLLQPLKIQIPEASTAHTSPVKQQQQQQPPNGLLLMSLNPPTAPVSVVHPLTPPRGQDPALERICEIPATSITTTGHATLPQATILNTSTSLSTPGLKNITNTYFSTSRTNACVSHTSGSQVAHKLSPAREMKQVMNLSKSSYTCQNDIRKMATDQEFFAPISMKCIPPHSSFREDKLWRPW